MKPCFETLESRCQPSILTLGPVPISQAPIPQAIVQQAGTAPQINLTLVSDKPSVAPGETFTVSEQIAGNISEMMGLGSMLAFDPSQVEVVSISAQSGPTVPQIGALNPYGGPDDYARCVANVVNVAWFDVDGHWQFNNSVISVTFRALPGFTGTTFGFFSTTTPAGIQVAIGDPISVNLTGGSPGSPVMPAMIYVPLDAIP